MSLKSNEIFNIYDYLLVRPRCVEYGLFPLLVAKKQQHRQSVESKPTPYIVGPLHGRKVHSFTSL